MHIPSPFVKSEHLQITAKSTWKWRDIALSRHRHEIWLVTISDWKVKNATRYALHGPISVVTFPFWHFTLVWHSWEFQEENKINFAKTKQNWDCEGITLHIISCWHVKQANRRENRMKKIYLMYQKSDFPVF